MDIHDPLVCKMYKHHRSQRGGGIEREKRGEGERDGERESGGKREGSGEGERGGDERKWAR